MREGVLGWRLVFDQWDDICGSGGGRRALRCAAGIAAGFLLACAPDALTWSGHMSFCSGRTWVEILCDALEGEVGTPFEVSPFESLSQHCNRGAAQRLVCKSDAVGACSDGVGECSDLSLWGGLHGRCFGGPMRILVGGVT